MPRTIKKGFDASKTKEILDLGKGCFDKKIKKERKDLRNVTY